MIKPWIFLSYYKLIGTCITRSDIERFAIMDFNNVCDDIVLQICRLLPLVDLTSLASTSIRIREIAVITFQLGTHGEISALKLLHDTPRNKGHTFFGIFGNSIISARHPANIAAVRKIYILQRET